MDKSKEKDTREYKEKLKHTIKDKLKHIKKAREMEKDLEEAHTQSNRD